MLNSSGIVALAGNMRLGATSEHLCVRAAFLNRTIHFKTNFDMETNVNNTTKPKHDAKLPVGRNALLDWSEKVKKAKRDFAIAFTNWANSPEHKKMIEGMKRLGGIR